MRNNAMEPASRAIGYRIRLLAILTAAAFFLAAVPQALAASSDFKMYEGFKTLARIFYEINVKFVEEPDSTEMVNGAVRGMLNTLDPHSSYLTPEEMNEFQQETGGSFTGVGMELSVKDSVVTVVAPIDDTPASRAGIMSGDQLISIDDKSTTDMSVMEVVKLIRGPLGTKVTITVNRPATKRILTFTLTRDHIPLRSVRSEELTPGIGYIHISNFQADTAAEVEKAIVSLGASSPLQGLVLDLRNDPGGLLEQSIRVSGLFIGQVLVVETRGRFDDQNMDYNSEQTAVLPYNCPVVVLVNEGSASASEIVAGALQDYGRATILGAKTFGKGSVQSVVRLPDGSGLRLTTARFYTPSGRPIQSEGITPDVVVPSLLPPNYKPTREVDLERHLLGANERGSRSRSRTDSVSVEESDDSEELEAPSLPDKPIRDMTLAERLEYDKQLNQALEMLKKGQVKSGFNGAEPRRRQKVVG
ncbi:MAG: S41 family peptidase [Deltaproteobacteria bacterium]|jgi:carboxyl-terminal processing protease|nr:S41 family peptidase [Deltaproteobacteria bacterium]